MRGRVGTAFKYRAEGQEERSRFSADGEPVHTYHAETMNGMGIGIERMGGIPLYAQPKGFMVSVGKYLRKVNNRGMQEASGKANV